MRQKLVTDGVKAAKFSDGSVVSVQVVAWITITHLCLGLNLGKLKKHLLSY